MMTSFAFILGVVPLVISGGAGAECALARDRGFLGHVGVTLFGIFLTPVFFYVIQFFGDFLAQAGPVPTTDGVHSHHGTSSLKAAARSRRQLPPIDGLQRLVG